MEILRFENVTKRYGDNTVLDNVTLSIGAGEVFSLLGPSGCGKTTLLRICGGFEKPDSGRVILDGVDITDLPPNRREVRTVFQNYALFPHMTVWENIAFGLKASGVNHSNMVPDVLGRYRGTDKDTLTLELRGDGIDCRCDLPETNNANDALELIRRGDINGMSFAFEDDWEDTENGVSYERTNDVEDGKEVWLRHVKKITGLYDVAIVTHPAYEQTSVGMREASDRIDAAIEAQIKRECGGKKKAEDGEETDEEKAAREQAEREANGGETNAEKEAREAAEREANGGETNAEKEAREQRELEEQEQRFRESRAMRLRAQRKRTAEEIESLNY